MCFDDALDPNGTDWRTTPPRVRTAKQRNYGAWERGAYVYKGTDASEGSAGISAPAGLIIVQ
jgi:hypothetical protein